VLIAHLMLEPADLLLLDEPTNDLDIPTLEVLEESLLEFEGALVLVTHDRYLLDRVSTQLLALDGHGGATAYADYPQWEIGERAALHAATLAAVPRPAKPAAPRSGTAKPRRLGYLERREWGEMEARIAEAERVLAESRAALEDPVVASDPTALATRYAAAESARAAVESLYGRWAELERKQSP
jgi:ATP-binding cassette subfamily F protein uup